MRNTRMGCGPQNSAWVVAMGRSLESVRMGIKDISARRLKACKELKKEDQIYG